MSDLATCDIADGMLLSGIEDGGEIPYVLQQSGPRRTVVGPAYTVEFAPKSDPRPAAPQHYIDSVPRGAVVLIATSPNCHLPYAPYTSVRQSLYGGLMSTRAQFLGAAASVVLGLVRDVDEHRALDYPVFSYGVGCCAANQTTKVVAVNQPLALPGGSVVAPGDVVYADRNGVVVVPASIHDEVAARAQQRVLANEHTAKDICDGVPAQAAQAARRKQFA